MFPTAVGGERGGRGGSVLARTNAYAFGTCPVREPPPRSERLEHQVSPVIVVAVVGNDIQFVCA